MLSVGGFELMKRGCVSSWVAVFALVAGLALPLASHAQVSAYGEFSGTYLHNLASSNTLFGATTGVIIDGPTLKRLVISADLQGRFVGGSGLSMNGVTAGPRFSIQMHHPRITPFAEFMVGFARFDNGLGLKTTDNTFQFNGGIAKQLTPRWDAVVDYSYAQYFYGGGQYNPKTFSIGGIYHFVKR
jgi:hypothetical protein